MPTHGEKEIFNAALASGTWQPLTGTTFTDSGAERTVTDPAASGATKFYRVNVSKPYGA